MEARRLVEKAKLTVEPVQTDSNIGSLRDFAKKAEGMLVLPQMVSRHVHHRRVGG